MKNLVKQASDELRQLLMEALARAVAKELLPAEALPDFTIEIPADASHGDLATNLALISARPFHMPPRKIAEIIGQNLDLAGSSFTTYEIAGPGFLNFCLGANWFSDVLLAIQTEQSDYGSSDYGNGEKWMVEFVSANPTGPMHIGNARGGAIGDCLAEILNRTGYHVDREFYVNDAGNQIEKFAASLNIRYLQYFLKDEAPPLPEDAYQGQDIADHAAAFAQLYGDRYLNCEESVRKQALVDYALPKNIDGLKRDLETYRIVYDNWFFESTLYREHLVETVVERLKEKGLTYEKEGAVWYASTQFGCEKDDVLIRANGVPTYFAADIAYHYHKFAIRGYERVINVWGADHHGHVARLKGAMNALGIDGNRLDVVLMQMVRLIRDGKPVKVSKRSGKSITLVSLLDEIPIDAARFFFNLREANSHFDFDLDLAVEESSKNPVYYVQYAHARICSILRNLAEEGLTPNPAAETAVLTSPEERELIRFLATLPNELLEAARQYDPARITRYSLDLAALFHKFYNSCHVKGSELPLLEARLKLVDSVRIVLEIVLSILKITAPETM